MIAIIETNLAKPVNMTILKFTSEDKVILGSSFRKKKERLIYKFNRQISFGCLLSYADGERIAEPCG